MATGAMGASTLVVQSIKQFMDRGETIVLTQQTDSGGNVKNTIAAGGKSYVVEAGKVETLPAELRPLALQLLAGSPATGKTSGNVATVANAKVAMKVRVRLRSKRPGAACERLGKAEPGTAGAIEGADRADAERERQPINAPWP